MLDELCFFYNSLKKKYIYVLFNAKEIIYEENYFSLEYNADKSLFSYDKRRHMILQNIFNSKNILMINYFTEKLG